MTAPIRRPCQAVSFGAAGQLPGYNTRADGHLHVATAIAAGLADTGIASEPSALAYDLPFILLAAERFDLVIPAGYSAPAKCKGC